MPRVSLKKRRLDLLYFVFFLIHIPATLFVDLQSFYPQHLVPQFLKSFLLWYLKTSGDPLVSGAAGLHGAPGQYAWIQSFLLLESFFQIPVFFIGLWGLWRGSAQVNVLLLIYAASTTTTVLPCVATILALPSTTELTIKGGLTSLTLVQRVMLMSSFLPFLLVPLVMTVDMGLRTAKLVKLGSRAIEKAGKKRM